MRNLFLLALFFGSTCLFEAKAQQSETSKTWTLQECLQYALDNNIQVKKSKVNYLSGNEDTEEAKARLFPSLTASVTQGFVNYPSNEVVSNNSYSGNYTLNSNWTIYDGNQRNNTIKQRKLQDSMNELAVEQSEDDIRLSIIQVYMQVLYAMESVRINENTVETSTAERDRAKELYAEGSISRVDLAQLESQLSTDKYQLVSAQTSLDNYKLQLKQLLELDINQDINVASPILTETDVLGALPSKQNIYETALSVMPQIKSSELSISSAELEIKKAKGAYMPTLSMNAGIGTGHLSGTDYTFGSQIWNKFNESVGLTLSVPIFANRSNKTALNKAKYALTTSELEHLNEQKTLLKEVETIYLDAVSAQTKYVSSSENLAYVTESYDLTQQQFFLGMKNTVELLTEKNNYLTAQQTQLQSKYMAIMSKELLNVYQKKNTELKY
jgi:outer membrane protein